VTLFTCYKPLGHGTGVHIHDDAVHDSNRSFMHLWTYITADNSYSSLI